jgi:hypothetical protein
MNKRTLALLFSFLLFVISLSLCGFLFQAIVKGCFFRDCAPKRSWSLEDFDIPTTFFPQDATFGSFRRLHDSFIENKSKTIYWDDGSGLATYTIFRFPTTEQALSAFEDEIQRFRNPDSNEMWTTPPNSTFTSSVANSVYIACGDWANLYRCGVGARYEEHVIVYKSVIDSEMTYQDFEKIVIYLDKQISSRLNP